MEPDERCAMDDSSNPRSEFWQMFALALRPPCADGLRDALAYEFEPELQALCTELGADLGGALDPLPAQMASLADPQALLAVYSRLFLVPPMPARLELGWHLDRAMNGATVQLITGLMARHGLALRDEAREAPDLLPATLELLAWLFQRHDASGPENAGGPSPIDVLRRRCLLPGVSALVPLARAAEADHGLPSVYSTLLRALQLALEDRSCVFFSADDQKPCCETPQRLPSSELVHCVACGAPIASAEDIAVVIDRLSLAGLPYDHLTHCPECRDIDRGWKPGVVKLDVMCLR